MANQHTPLVGDNGFAHHAKFTTFTAAIDLRAQATYPTHCPQQLLLVNNTTGALNATVTDIAGHSFAWPIDARSAVYTPIGSWKQIEAATDDTLSAIFAFWWVDGATTLNP